MKKTEKTRLFCLIFMYIYIGDEKKCQHLQKMPLIADKIKFT